MQPSSRSGAYRDLPISLALDVTGCTLKCHVIPWLPRVSKAASPLQLTPGTLARWLLSMLHQSVAAEPAKPYHY